MAESGDICLSVAEEGGAGNVPRSMPVPVPPKSAPLFEPAGWPIFLSPHRDWTWPKECRIPNLNEEEKKLLDFAEEVAHGVDYENRGTMFLEPPLVRPPSSAEEDKNCDAVRVRCERVVCEAVQKEGERPMVMFYLPDAVPRTGDEERIVHVCGMDSKVDTQKRRVVVADPRLNLLPPLPALDKRKMRPTLRQIASALEFTCMPRESVLCPADSARAESTSRWLRVLASYMRQ